MHNLVIRHCETKDIEVISTIYAEAVINGVATFELEPPTVTEMLQRREWLLVNNYPYLVAEKARQVVGYAYAGAFRARPAFHGTVEDSIYLNKEVRGQGIGKALLQQLIIEAELRNFRQMVAVIGDSANYPSLRLHASLGFKQVGTLQSVGWKHNRWLDTVLMQLALGESDRTPY